MIYAIYMKMTRSEDHYVKWNNLDSESQVSYFLSFEDSNF